MVFLCIPPLSRRHDLGREGRLIPLRADLLCNLLGNRLLLGTMCKDSTAVLCADIRTLSVFCGGVVHAVKEFEELAVCHD